MKLLSKLTAGLLLSISSAHALAQYSCPPGTRWPGATTTLHFAMPNQSPSGELWSASLADAASEWNEKTDFTFQLEGQYRDPCAGLSPGTKADFQNGADFSPSMCGSSFNSNVLAITTYFCEGNILGSTNLVEADIVFNSNRSFDIYDGPQRFVNGSTQFDFRRVALHELGHMLGLQGHEDSAPAIMASNIGNLFRLQQNDIDRVNTLYSSFANCESRQAGFGWFHDGLNEGDCRVFQLMSGGTDQSFVDVYKLEITSPLTLIVDTITDGLLDSVLLLTDRQLGIIEPNADAAGDCRPRITRQLQPGHYALLVNTYSIASNSPCGRGNTGEYRLSVTYESAQLLPLAGRESFQGGVADAEFHGAVAVMRGGNRLFTNRVTASEVFDVLGQIRVDPAHVGQPGFIVVAGITHEGEILVKRPDGDFAGYQPEAARVPIYQRRVLETVEDIDVLKQMIAQDIGISSIEVNFLVGYGVDSNPTELYFHQQPINLIIE